MFDDFEADKIKKWEWHYLSVHNHNKIQSRLEIKLDLNQVKFGAVFMAESDPTNIHNDRRVSVFRKSASYK